MVKRKTKAVTVLSAAICLTLGMSMSSAAADGWNQEGDKWIYLDREGNRVTQEWKKDNGESYYLDENGVMAVSRIVEDGDEDIYYVDASGRRVKNQWISMANDDGVKVNDEQVTVLYYYFGDNGKACRADGGKEWQEKTIEGKRYFFDSEGLMGSGWIEIDDKIYYCGEQNDGSAATGWKYLEPKEDTTVDHDYESYEWYHFTSSGRLQKAAPGGTITVSIDNGKYTLDENGVWLPGDGKADAAKAEMLAEMQGR